MPEEKPGKKQRSSQRDQASPRVATRRRLTPEIRREQILDAAARLAVKQGFLPLPIERLAQDAGASKALIYTYFPTQYDIANALLQRELANLQVAGLHTAIQIEDLDQAVLVSAMLYFEHVVQYGALMHILVTDLYMTGHHQASLVEQGSAILRQLLKVARDALSLPDEEIRAAIEMMAAIPEEAGSLAFHKELEASIARQLCHTLTLSSLQALRACGKVVARTRDRT